MKSHRLLAGGNPVLVTIRRPGSDQPVHLGDRVRRSDVTTCDCARYYLPFVRLLRVHLAQILLNSNQLDCRRQGRRKRLCRTLHADHQR